MAWNSADEHIASGECLEVTEVKNFVIPIPTHDELEVMLGMSLSYKEATKCIKFVEKALYEHIRDEVRFWWETKTSVEEGLIP